MSFWDFGGGIASFVSGSSPNGSDYGVDQTTQTVLDQMSNSIDSILTSLQTNNNSILSNLQSTILNSIGKYKSSMSMSLNNTSSSGSAGASGTIASAGAIAGILAAMNSISPELEQITYTGGEYVFATIGKTEYIEQMIGQAINNMLDNGMSVSQLQDMFNSFYSGNSGEKFLANTPEFEELLNSIKADAETIFGGVAGISMSTGAGLGAILASVLTIPGDSQQPTQDQIDAAITQYQLEQNQEIQEQMGNLETEVGEQLVAGSDLAKSSMSESLNLVGNIILGTTQNLQLQLSNLINKEIISIGSKYGGATSDGGPTQELVSSLSGGLL